MKPPKAPSLRMEAPLGALTLEREEMLSRAQIEQMRAGLGAAGPLAQAVLNGNAAGLVGTLPVGVVAPTGAVMAFAAATAWGPPDGWLECNGATLSKQQYPALFNVIGATYGSTDTTFNLPTITQIGSNIKYVVKT
jgi:hypothetical protein